MFTTAADNVQQQMQPAPGPPGIAEPAVLLGLGERRFSSTTDLISGMQARFSEAEEFLRSLQLL